RLAGRGGVFRLADPARGPGGRGSLALLGALRLRREPRISRPGGAAGSGQSRRSGVPGGVRLVAPRLRAVRSAHRRARRGAVLGVATPAARSRARGARAGGGRALGRGGAPRARAVRVLRAMEQAARVRPVARGAAARRSALLRRSFLSGNLGTSRAVSAEALWRAGGRRRRAARLLLARGATVGESRIRPAGPEAHRLRVVACASARAACAHGSPPDRSLPVARGVLGRARRRPRRARRRLA